MTNENQTLQATTDNPIRTIADALNDDFLDRARAVLKGLREEENPDCAPWCYGRGSRLAESTARPLGAPSMTELDLLRLRREFSPCEHGEQALRDHEARLSEANATQRQCALDRAEIPPKRQRFTLDTYAQNDRDAKVIEMVREWKGTGTSMVIAGGIGSGKTALAAAILHDEVVSGSGAGLFITAIRLLRALRPTPDGIPDPIVDRLYGSEMLVVDDLGSEADPSAWALEQWHDLLDTRIGFGGVTIITTNLTAEQIGERYGAPILDRIHEMISSDGQDDNWWIELTGESRRGSR